ncbi:MULTISPECIES: hypothetical protein [unclassified Streptomyces]|uniref:hypothetical protein n=1 Tax=unclassified Streptomyces TaxID=2593676 RepID=UPI00159F194C|nr:MULTISPECIES: hypothetical protein [unclassified Streptomyces]MDQ0701058.1 hypothetical protein [Streptomyces sp. W4I9-2]
METATRRSLRGLEGAAWAPAYNVTDLLRALTGGLMYDLNVRCAVHGPNHSDDQDDEDTLGLEVRELEAIHG